MAQNPYEKGTMEYLDWATAQHDEAMAPKPKKKKKTAKKKAPAVEQRSRGGLAEALAEAERSQKTGKEIGSGLGGLAKTIVSAF